MNNRVVVCAIDCQRTSKLSHDDVCKVRPFSFHSSILSRSPGALDAVQTEEFNK